MKLFIYISLFLLGVNSLFTQAHDSKEKLVIEGFGSNINTDYEELNPILTPDGNTIFFCRSNSEQNNGIDDIWISYKDEDGNWSLAEHAGDILNRGESNFVCSVTPEGRSILFVTEFETENGRLSGLFISNLGKFGWSEPEPVIVKDYKNYSDRAGFYLSNDHRTMLMTIQDDSSLGEKDIYVCFREEGNTFSKPQNLGSIINTVGDELSPFIASDGVTLYFSSDGHGGFGDADVFMARRLDNTWLNWTEPENLGPTVNTSGWDAQYKIDARGEVAVFASQMADSLSSDIFSVRVPKQFRPDPVTLIRGMVYSARSLVPLSASIQIIALESNASLNSFNTKFYSESIFGFYVATVPVETKYQILVEHEGYYSKVVNLDNSKITEYKEIGLDLGLVPVVDSLVCMRNIFFEHGLYNLRPESRNRLKEVRTFLKKNRGFDIQVIGHTDNTGPYEVNIKLAEDRANSAVDYLLRLGVKSKRLIISHHGPDLPVIKNTNDIYRQLNRRVEFKLILNDHNSLANTNNK